MPAKKKHTTNKTVAELTELLERVTAQWKETKEQLDARNAELFETRARLDLAWRVNDAEVEFWKKEVEHLQQRAVDAVLNALKK